MDRVLRHVTRALLLCALWQAAGSEAMAQSSVGPFAVEPIEIAGDAPNYLEFGAGAFNVLAHQTSPAPEGQVQFRFGVGST